MYRHGGRYYRDSASGVLTVQRSVRSGLGHLLKPRPFSRFPSLYLNAMLSMQPLVHPVAVLRHPLAVDVDGAVVHLHSPPPYQVMYGKRIDHPIASYLERFLEVFTDQLHHFFLLTARCLLKSIMASDGVRAGGGKDAPPR